MAISSIQGIVHVVMLVVIIAFASQYHQLGLQYEELLKTCSNGNGVKREQSNAGELAIEPTHLVKASVVKHSVHSDDLALTSSVAAGSVTVGVDIYQRTEEMNLEPSQIGHIPQSPFDSSETAFHATENYFSATEYAVLSDKESFTIDSVTNVGDFYSSSAELEHTDVLSSSSTVDNVNTQPEAPPSRSDVSANIYVLPSSSYTEQQPVVDNTEYINRNVLALGQKATSDNLNLSFDNDAKTAVASSELSASTPKDSFIPTQTSVTLPSLNKYLERISDDENSGFTIEHDSETACGGDLESGSSPHQTAEDVCTYGVGGSDSQPCDNSVSPVKVQTTQFEELEVADSESSTSLTDDVMWSPGRPVASEETDFNMEVLDAAEKKKLGKDGTSVWCSDLDKSGTSCHFQNLCYSMVERDFVFLKSDESKIETTHKDFMEGQFSLSLSAVPDHNAYTFRPVTIPGDMIDKFSVTNMLRPAFLLSRFKPDNIMHVLHDDLLPLVHTLHLLKFQRQGNRFDITTVFTDFYDEGDYLPLYSSVSTMQPIVLWKSKVSSDFICFKNVYLGLSNRTLWYQYGFTVPQGPLTIDKVRTGTSVSRAAKHISGNLSAECFFCHKKNYIAFLSRKDTRVVLNEGELILALARSTKLKVMSISLETHSLAEILTIVKNSKGIVGMHGSLLSLATFLSPGSIVIELFPYAVNSSKYTPFKSMCELGAFNLIYKAWTNPSKDRSVFHPDWPAKAGGILHLPKAVQKQIMDQTEVPDHLCCEDPSWLYHIYQDTLVDIDSVVALTFAALSEADAYLNSSVEGDSAGELASEHALIFPGPVRSLLCNLVNDSSGKGAFNVSWSAPWNVEFVAYETFSYHLLFQQRGIDILHDVKLPHYVRKYSLQYKGNHYDAEYNVWLRAVFDNTRKSAPSFVSCLAPR